jgi:hypothetical protein
MEQFPGDRNKVLKPGFLTSQVIFVKGFHVGIATRGNECRHVKRSSQMPIASATNSRLLSY